MIATSPVVREIFESDVEELAPLFVKSLDTSIPGVTFSTHPRYELDKVVSSLRVRLFPPKSRKTYVLELHTGDIVGYGNIKPDGGPNHDEDELDMFFVKAGHGGQGYGSQLMATIQRDCRERGLWLHVFKKNERAIRFYKKWGFRMREEEFDLSLPGSVLTETICLMRWSP